MLDHVFITVGEIDRSRFMRQRSHRSVSSLGMTMTARTDLKDRPERVGTNARIFFWLRQGLLIRDRHIGLVTRSEAKVNAFYDAAMKAGDSDNGSRTCVFATTPATTPQTSSIRTGAASRASTSWPHPKS